MHSAVFYEKKAQLNEKTTGKYEEAEHVFQSSSIERGDSEETDDSSKTSQNGKSR